jgi:predicted nucleic acid-binding protein
LIPQLSFLFSRVLLPKAVREELFKRRATKDRLQVALNRYEFLDRCDDYDKGAVEVLLIERATQRAQDRGETEAVVQAAKAGARVIVDDPWGRKLAARYRRDYHGCLWVLNRFFQLRRLSASDLRRNFITLRDNGIRLPWDTSIAS